MIRAFSVYTNTTADYKLTQNVTYTIPFDTAGDPIGFGSLSTGSTIPPAGSYLALLCYRIYDDTGGFVHFHVEVDGAPLGTQLPGNDFGAGGSVNFYFTVDGTQTVEFTALMTSADDIWVLQYGVRVIIISLS